MAKKRQKEVILQIRCKSLDTKIAFKVLATRLVETYEETLKRLMKLEKKNPLEKKETGVTVRL